MKSYKFSLTAILSLITVLYSCKRGGYKIPYPEELGTVLGKEICEQDPSADFWLINFDKDYGDTLTYKGIFYNHVAKTNQLDPLLKKTGMRVYLWFEISPDKMSSSACVKIPSEIYFLHTLKLHLQAEKR